MATYTGTLKRTSNRRIRTAIYGAALVLAVGAGVGGWQLTRHGQPHRAASATARVQPVALVSSGQGSTGAVPSSSAAVSRTVADPIVYIVDSEQQMAMAQLAIDFEHGLEVQINQPATDERVVQVASEAEANSLHRDNADQNNFRALAGLPPVLVVDLRAASGTTETELVSSPESALPAASSLSPSAEGPRVLLVASPEQAAMAQRGIDFEHDLQAQLGLATSDDSVAQVADEAEATRVFRDSADQNGFRALAGLPPIDVIDLR